MREMKDTGVVWIGRIPSQWDISTVNSLYTLRNQKVSDRDYPPLSVTMKGIVPQLNTAAKTDAHDDRKLVRKGDFAINSRSDRRGSCGISDYDGSVSLINIVLTPRGKMHPEYYNWLFHSSRFADEFYRWGHGIVDDLWTTRWQEMRNISIPVPEYAIQQRIADHLDHKCTQIDALIANAQQQIEKLKAYKQSVITEAVTKGLDSDVPMKDSGNEYIGEIPDHWKTIKIKYLCTMQAGKNLISEQISESGIYPVYGGNGIRGFFSEPNYKGECLLIGRQGALCGNVHHVSGEFWATEHAVITEPTEAVSIRYLFYLLTGINLNLYVSPTAAQPGLSVNSMQNVIVCLSPRNEQQQIAEYLDKKCEQIERLIAIKQQKIYKTQQYKKSIIYEYVTGKKEV